MSYGSQVHYGGRGQDCIILLTSHHAVELHYHHLCLAFVASYLNESNLCSYAKCLGGNCLKAVLAWIVMNGGVEDGLHYGKADH